MRALLLVLALLVAGCVSAPEAADIEAASADPVEAASLEPQVFDWTGHVVASEVEGYTHFRPYEDVLWPVFQEGILFHVQELPEAMEVSLDWTGGGAFMIMLHSHKGEETNVYVEHISELDDVNPKCIRVPTEDLTEGHWQVMVHSEGAHNVDFTLHVGLLGGAGDIDLSERHGHDPEDGTFDIDKHDSQACEFMLPADAS